jgi:hypothetical protein
MGSTVLQRQRHYQRHKAQVDAYNRKWLKQHPDRRHHYHLKSRFGITTEQYQEMLASQNGVCAICHKLNSNGRRLAVDHNHATGEVRGLLCDRCNRLVGTIENNNLILLQAMAYLDRKGD